MEMNQDRALLRFMTRIFSAIEYQFQMKICNRKLFLYIGFVFVFGESGSEWSKWATVSQIYGFDR
jgi:hypothetical protein